MSQRIKWSLGLMAISIFGIVFTQGYWLYKDYNYYRGQPLLSSRYDFYARALTAVPITAPAVIGTAVLSKSATPLPVSGAQMPVLIAYPAGTTAAVKGTASVAARERNDTLTLGGVQSTNVSGVSARLGTAIPLAAPVSPVVYKTIEYAPPVSYILEKMKFQFGSSIVLILVTSSCYIYMLVTIFMQKKMSLAKNDFINSMTHELKTPLATVSVAIEAMKTFGVLEDKNKARHYLDVSKKELEHLSKMIEMIMQLSIHENYQMELSKKDVVIEALIGQVLEKYSLSHPALVMTTELENEMAKLYLDPVHLSNAIQNLIDNSIKYSTPPVRITLSSKVINGYWVLSIADNGPGIPKKYQKEIFDRFFRVPVPEKHTTQGFGLGLFYVKQVAELHGGSVSVVSEEGKGSNFNISFPI